MATLSAAVASWSPSAASVAVVWMPGRLTVCPSSFRLAWVATTLPARESSSVQTSLLPSSPVPSTSKATSTVPSEDSGVTVVSAVASSLPVSASSRRPLTLYSVPWVTLE